MSFKAIDRKAQRFARHRRLRQKVHGTSERPRMAMMVSGRNMYVQFIDDERGITLFACSTLKGDAKHNVGGASVLGKCAGEGAIKAGIKKAVVDRGGFKFHGRIKAIVEAVKAAGIVFETKEER